MSATALRERLEAGESLEVVDIREEDEFDAWHIFGSRNVPVYNAIREGRSEGLAQQAESLPNDRPIVTVCRVGMMSQRAAGLLESLGFEAISLAGGIRGWGAVWSVAEIASESDAVFLQIRRNGKGCLSYLFGTGGQACVVDPCVESVCAPLSMPVTWSQSGPVMRSREDVFARNFRVGSSHCSKISPAR